MDEQLVEKITKKILEKLKGQGLLYDKSILCLNFSQKQEKEMRESNQKYDLHFSSVLQMTKDYDEVWIGNLSIQDLSQTALGLRANIGNLVQELAKGTKIVVLSSEYESFKERYSLPESLLNMWEDYSRRLEAMGVIFKDEGSQFSKGQATSRSGERIYLNKKLISQEDLGPLKGKNATVVVPKKSMITPLAMDFCKENNIQVERESETEDASR